MYKKWWIWLLSCIAFLVAVHILFTIPAPYPWLKAVWSAGDLIVFVGTVVLGFVALQQSRLANETSQKLIDLQTADYLPKLVLVNFVGFTKHNATLVDDNVSTDINIFDGRTKDNELILGYGLNLLDNQFDASKKVFSREYEFSFKYSSSMAISSIRIKSLRFINADKVCGLFDVNKSIEMTLINDQEFRFFLFFVSNNDFTAIDSPSYSYIMARKLEILIEMESIMHRNYEEAITINKFLVKEPSKEFEQENTECYLTASINCRDITL
jgi:hypothetical protein